MPALIPAKHVPTLERLATDAADDAVRQRARLLLLYDAGTPSKDVAAAVGLSVSSVLRWRRIFADKGMAMFPEDALAPAAEPTPPTTPEQAPEEAVPAEAPPAKPAEDKAAKTKAAPDKPAKEKGASKFAKRLARIGDALEDVIEDAERITHLKTITEAKPLKQFIGELKTHRKSLKKGLKAKKLKKKVARKLGSRLKVLEKQIRRAEKILAKME